jgi:demethylmenaquinone methyltransferase/2-methoxy-6-polyprenyl-1,4-benzoquinol methylase
MRDYYPLFMSVQERIATPEGKRRYVRSLFGTIADRYDFITVLLSYGRDREWKKRLVRLAAPSPGSSALDLATGTGDIAFAIRERCGQVIGIDITPRMIELARRKAAARPSPAFLVADMLALPFAAGSFDLVTTGYGLRNVSHLDRAIDEILRVLKPGGQVLSLDFDRPANRIVRAFYLAYLMAVGGALGWLLHGDPDTYRYIPASIRNYPGAAAVAGLMASRGFAEVRHYPVLGGLMAIHRAVKSGSAVPAASGS